MRKCSQWSTYPNIVLANSSLRFSFSWMMRAVCRCGSVVGSTQVSSGSQPAVGFAGLCDRAVHRTGRRLKAFEGVNTIFWQSMKKNEVHRETQKGTERKIIMDTISNKEATTQRAQELRTMLMLMPKRRLRGKKRGRICFWFFLYLFLLKWTEDQLTEWIKVTSQKVPAPTEDLMKTRLTLFGVLWLT